MACAIGNGHFQCKCCHYLQAKFQFPSSRANIMSSAGGMAPSNWTRLQTFKPHHASSQHKVAATIFIRETMPHISLHRVDSPAEDFHDLLKNIKARKATKLEKYVKRNKLRAMMYCLAEAKRGAKQSLFAVTPQASIMHDGADSE